MVDDEPLILRGIDRTLSKVDNWRALVAKDADTAMDLWHRHRDSIDIVLSDIYLPHVDGIELIDRLEAAGMDLPVILMSGYTHDHALDAYLVDPTRGLLGKPFKPAALIEQLQSMLAASSGEEA